MRRLFLALAFLTLPAAPALAAKVEQIQSPSGIPVNYVKCARKPARCMNEAADYCEGSYQVIDSESHTGTMVTDAMSGSVTWYSMTFLCGRSNGDMPTFPSRGPNGGKPSAIIPPGVSTVCNVLGRGQNCLAQ